MITVVGLVHVEAGRLLVVRSRNKKAFYLPGGKIEPGETPVEDAVRREVREELGIEISRARRPEALRRSRVRRG